MLVWETGLASNTLGAPDWVGVVCLMHDIRHS